MINITKVVISLKEIKAIEAVCKSGQIAQGKRVSEFEEKFAEFCGTKYAVAVNSGTAALHSALYAYGIKAGDEVITAPFTFVATANSILMVGAKPVFVDVDEETFNIDAKKIKAKINKKTKAILPVHLYGQPADMTSIIKIIEDYGRKIFIVEDCAQAVGAEVRFESKGGNAPLPPLKVRGGTGELWRKVGSIGDVGCFSFYATKNLTTGEGGMVVTNDKKVAEKVKMFRHHGQSEKVRYEYYGLGYNYRMTEIAAVIGIEQLKKIDELNKKRIENARILTNGLKDIPGLLTPKVQRGYKHVFHQYTLRVTHDFKLTRNKLVEYLSKKGIKTAVYYPKPLHGGFPVSEKLCSEVLSIPVHPHLTKRDLNYIIKTFKGI